jgi:hypothetical protein
MLLRRGGLLGARPPLPVEEADPPVAQVVRREGRNPGGLAGADNRRAQRVGAGAGEQRRVGVAEMRPLVVLERPW